MPNGGVPLHMVIRPHEGTSVVYCRGAELRVVPQADWDRVGTQATPSLVLNQAEARVLARFLRYWLRDDGSGPIYHETGVDAVFDF